MTLSDTAFLEQFEQQTLPPEHFNHQGHLRLAWLYLNLFDLATAVDKVCLGIKTYAESLGATDKFHWTITDALVRIMAKRMGAEDAWPVFLQNNQDLLNDALTILHQYYSEELLNSTEARMAVQQPDIKAI